MTKVTIHEEHEVPDGEYCFDFAYGSDDRCEFLNSETTRINWSDGLGSSGMHTNYFCTLFREFTIEKYPSEEERIKGIRGLRMIKCQKCLEFEKQTVTEEHYEDKIKRMIREGEAK